MKASGQKTSCRAGVLCGQSCAAASSPQGFALVELLITLALILILTTMYWGFTSASHQRQQQQACQANLAKIYVALGIYANDHDGRFPEVAGARTSEEPLNALLPRYTMDTASFICPGSKDAPLRPGESLIKGRISYAYYMGWRATDAQATLMSDRQVDTLSKAAGQAVFSLSGQPPGNNHHKYGGNILFGDGRLELTPACPSFSLALTQGVVLLNPKP